VIADQVHATWRAGDKARAGTEPLLERRDRAIARARRHGVPLFNVR
jgi:hypothetical protein